MSRSMTRASHLHLLEVGTELAPAVGGADYQAVQDLSGALSVALMRGWKSLN